MSPSSVVSHRIWKRSWIYLQTQQACDVTRLIAPSLDCQPVDDEAVRGHFEGTDRSRTPSEASVSALVATEDC